MREDYEKIRIDQLNTDLVAKKSQPVHKSLYV